MPSISDAMTEVAFAALDALCLKKLAHVSFGLQNSADRIVTGITFRLGNKQPISWKQRTALYAICYRYRRQIGDTPFIAKVLIARAEADPHAELERQAEHRPKVRAWQGSTSLPYS
jgi:hypothetical protein